MCSPDIRPEKKGITMDETAFLFPIKIVIPFMLILIGVLIYYAFHPAEKRNNKKLDFIDLRDTGKKAEAPKNEGYKTFIFCLIFFLIAGTAFRACLELYPDSTAVDTTFYITMFSLIPFLISGIYFTYKKYKNGEMTDIQIIRLKRSIRTLLLLPVIYIVVVGGCYLIKCIFAL